MLGSVVIVALVCWLSIVVVVLALCWAAGRGDRALPEGVRRTRLGRRRRGPDHGKLRKTSPTSGRADRR